MWRAAPWLAAAALAAVVVLWTYEASTSEGVSFDPDDPPEVWADRDIVLALYSVTEVSGASRYQVTKGFVPFAVEGDAQGLAAGDTVTLGGRWYAERRTFEASWREDHPWRRAKFALGAAGLVAIGLGLPLLFRLRGWRLESR